MNRRLRRSEGRRDALESRIISLHRRSAHGAASSGSALDPPRVTVLRWTLRQATPGNPGDDRVVGILAVIDYGVRSVRGDDRARLGRARQLAALMPGSTPSQTRRSHRCRSLGQQPGRERPQLLVAAQLLGQRLKDVFGRTAQFDRCPVVQDLVGVHGDGQVEAYSLGSQRHGRQRSPASERALEAEADNPTRPVLHRRIVRRLAASAVALSAVGVPMTAAAARVPTGSRGSTARRASALFHKDGRNSDPKMHGASARCRKPKPTAEEPGGQRKTWIRAARSAGYHWASAHGCAGGGTGISVSCPGPGIPGPARHAHQGPR